MTSISFKCVCQNYNTTHLSLPASIGGSSSRLAGDEILNNYQCIACTACSVPSDHKGEINCISLTACSIRKSQHLLFTFQSHSQMTVHRHRHIQIHALVLALSRDHLQYARKDALSKKLREILNSHWHLFFLIFASLTDCAKALLNHFGRQSRPPLHHISSL